MTATVDMPPSHYDAELDAVVVTGYDTAAVVLRGGDAWTSDIRNSPAFAEQFGGPDAAPPLLTENLLFMDPPRHTRLRRLVGPSFAAGRIAELRPRIAAIVDAALDGLAGAAEFDLVEDLAYPVPVAVIAELLDVGVEGAAMIRAEAEQLVGILELNPTERQLMGSAAATMSCTMFLLPLLTERRAHPGDDFISALLCVEVDGERLTIDEVLATVLLLLMAGHETTANLIANGVLRLLLNPEQLALLRQRPELIGPAVEELLRLDGTAKIIGRTAARDQVVGGLRVRAGQQLLIDVHACNRDPERFSDPERFDITRDDGTSHIAFGAGPHFCVGWALARAEAEQTLLRLFDRFPELTLRSEVPRWRESSSFHALQELPVTVQDGAR